MANQVDFKILPSDQFNVYSPQTRSEKVITYFTLLSKLRGDILAVSSQDDPNSIVSAYYTNVGNTQTLHLVKADGSEVTASNDYAGTVTSVGVSMPSAFTVTNSPITTSGTIQITGAGTTAQYVRGDGTLATFPSLTGFVPYVGATQNVDLGEYQIKAGQVAFDLTPTGTAGVGIMRWNDQDGTVDLGLIGGNVTLQIGQEQVVRVVNKSGINLTEAGYQAVKITGAQGNRLKVGLAQANNDANSADTIGLVTENIALNAEGFVTSSGLVRNIDTTGALQGETWADGDVIYLSPTTPGAVTKVKPTAPQHTVILGFVVRAHQTQGQIYVKVDNGYELEELHDVAPTPYVNNGVLYRDTATNLWKSATIPTVLGYTPANSTTTISTTAPLSGGGDLSANRTLSISQAGASTDGYLSSTDWNTFNNKASDAFKTIAVTGQSNIVADSPTDTLTFEAGSNIVITTDAANDKITINAIGGGSGSVTSVDMSVPTGFSISGNPITTSGTLALAFASGYSLPTNASQANWDTAYNNSITAFSYNTSTGVLTLTQQDAGTLTATVTLQPFTTDNLTQGSTNLYDKVVSLTGAGTTVVTGTYPNFTITSNDQHVGTVTSIATSAPITGGTITTSGTIGITQSGAAADGYLSSTDWNTFNSKVGGSGTVNYVSKWTSTGAIGNSQIFDSGTYVGINTATPAAKLDISGAHVASIGLLRLNSSASNVAAQTYYIDGVYKAATYAGTDDNFYILGRDADIVFSTTSSTTTRMVITNGGNVGIGTSGPTQKLMVSGSIRVTGGYYDSSNSIGSNGQVLASTGSGTTWINASGGTVNGSGTVNYLSKWTGTTLLGDSQLFDNGTNVGIGTATPAAKLDVSGNVRAAAALISQGGNNSWTGAAIFMDWQSTYGRIGAYNYATNAWMPISLNDNSIYITGANGNVGLGTTAPGVKLEVAGGIRATTSSGQIDVDPTSGAFRFYDGTTFRGGLGTGGWASVGATADIVQYLNGVNYYISNGSTALVKVEPTGKVGIGTTSPSTKLSVSGSDDVASTGVIEIITSGGTNLKIGGNTTYSWIQSHNSSPLYINQLGNNIILNLGGGNVGIGTASPGYKLDVSAAARVYGVRIGRDFSIANRATVRLDSNGDAPADILFGQTAAANQADWTGVYWSISSRNSGAGAAEGNKFTIWRGDAHSAPNNSESQFITITPGLNLGIGETSPTQKLHVSGNVRVTGAYYDSSNAAGTSGQILSSTGTGTAWISPGGGGGIITGSGTTNYVTKWTGTSAVGNSSIYDNGNVGIGTTSPAAPLHVFKSDTYSAIISRADWSGGIPTKLALGKQYGVLAFISTDLVETTNDTSYIALNYKSGLSTYAEGLRVYNNGNVGIGTTAPNSKLEVAGGIASTFGSTNGYVALQAGGSTVQGYIEWFKPNPTRVAYMGYNDGASANNLGLTLENSANFVINGGNVGIGTTSPLNKFAVIARNVYGYYETSAPVAVFQGLNPTLLVANDNNATDASSEIRLGNANSTYYSYSPYIRALQGGGIDSYRLEFGTSNFAAASTRMTISAAGNVGIGTTSPNAKLNVRGTEGSGSVSPQEDVLHVGGNELGGVGGYAGIRIGGASNTSYGAYIRGVKTTAYGNYWNTALTFSVTATNTETTVNEVMRITSAGNVGIGTTSPAGKLDVRAGSGGKIIFGSYDANYNVTIEGGDQLNFYNGASATTGYINYNGPGNILISRNLYVEGNSSGGTSGAVRITSAGNVGINETAPSQKLHVSGNIRVTGAYYDSSNAAGTSGQILSSTGTGTAWIAAPSGGGVSGSGTTNYVTKWTSGSAVGNSVMYDNGTNVGIGTTSPTSLLQVQGTPPGTSGSMINVRDSDANGSNTSFSGIFFNSSPGTDYSIGKLSSGPNGLFQIRNGNTGTGYLTINNSGNVGIGTTTPDAKLHVDGTVATNSALADVGAYRILKPNGGISSNTGWQTGAIKITYPVGYTYSMHRVKVNVYEYTTNESFTIYFGGYNYAASSEWYNEFAYILSNSGTDRNFTVRFGYDGSKMVVYIGELSSSWAYPQIFIEEVELGYSGHSATWRDGAWGIGFETSAFQNVTRTVSDTQATNWARNGSSTYYGFGNVGIGTTSPGYKLQVVGNNDILAVTSQTADTNLPTKTLAAFNGIYNSGGNGHNLYISSTGGTGSWEFNTTKTWGGFMSWGVSSNGTSITRHMSLTDSGNVGIGTTSPSGRLQVSSANAGDDQIWLQSTTYTGGYSKLGYNAVTGEFRITQNDGGVGTTFYTGSGTPSERMRITAAGNVGIGTTSPNNALTINRDTGAGNISSMPGVVFRNKNTTNSIFVHSGIFADTYRDVSDPHYSGGIWFTRVPLASNLTSGSDIIFGTGGYVSSGAFPDERMRITWDGAVGIGATSPTTTLDVRRNVPASSGTFPVVRVGNSSGDWGNYSMIEASNVPDGRAVRFGAYLGASAYSQGGFAVVTGDNGDIGTNPSIKLFVRHDGNVGIGTTSPGYKLDVSGTIRATGDVIAYSDARVKENVETLDGALDKVMKMRGVSYNKIGEQEKKVGVIAQEILEVLPEVVSQDETGTYSVAYGNISAVLIEAIKELTNTVKEQQKQIDELKAKLK